MHISEMFRLVRGTGHILDVLDILHRDPLALRVHHRDPLALRVHDGAFSAMDLAARHPRTSELLSTVKFMVQTLAAGELQHDLQREMTYDGLRAAEAKGATRAPDARPSRQGRPPPYAPRIWAAGPSPAWPRDHHVSRGAIRTAVADLLPEYTAVDQDAPELPVVLDMPGKVADFLRAADLEPAERAALDQGMTVRRGQGYPLRVSAAPEVHCQPLDGTQGAPAVPAQRKARRAYENRVNTLTADIRR
ncbi:hypothetical protein ABZ858_23650 [Streptomyces sp. NPDC047017]|uniref:hypothetical protein n=1 Tax=Streptomyces sp. NPDC047017 TaxID=3155024 RepID=UPI00340E45AF